MTAPDWSPVPFYFEIGQSRPGKESPSGCYRQHYDREGRIVLIEKPGARAVYRAYDYDQGLVNCLFGSEHKGAFGISTVSQCGRTEAGVGYDISTDLYARVFAYLWQPDSGQIACLQQWGVNDGVPSTTLVEYDAYGMPRSLTREGEVIWAARPKRKRSEPIPKGAAKMLKVVRKRRAEIAEPIVAFTLCYFSGDTETVPPDVFAISQREAEDFAANPSKFGNDPAMLWTPSAERPEPLASFSKKEIAFQWDEAEMTSNLEQLVDELNSQRHADEPPFVLVDLHGAASRHFDRLSPTDRARLDRYLKS